MRKALWAVVIVVVVVVLDIFLANVPGPVPTSQAISSVENSSNFKQVVGNGTYLYFGYSNEPSYGLRCVSTASDQFHLFDPFHEYTTTTLMFSVQPNITHPAQYPQPANDLPFIVLAQVDPGSGQIVSLQTQIPCV